jgi:hypothetical protein
MSTVHRVDIASFANQAGVRITPYTLTPVAPDGEDRSEDFSNTPIYSFVSIMANFWLMSINYFLLCEGTCQISNSLTPLFLPDTIVNKRKIGLVPVYKEVLEIKEIREPGGRISGY